MTDPVVEDPFKESQVDDPEVNDPDEDEELEGEQSPLVEEVADSAADLEQIAGEQLTDSLVQDVVSNGRSAAFNPMEAISRPDQKSARLAALTARRDSVLSSLTDADVSAAHVSFVDAMFGITFDSLAVTERGPAADRLLTQILYASKGQPLAPDQGSQAALDKVVTVWKGVSDPAFWGSFASYYDGEAITVDGAKEHLAFLRIAGDLSPLTQGFTWATESAKAFMVDRLIGASGATVPDNGGDSGGRIDIAEMYRTAATLATRGQSVPRTVAAELMRLALGQLAGGVESVARKPVEPARKSLERNLQPEQAQPGSDQKTQDAVRDRNVARAAA